MSDVLSQSQIDSLLATLSSGDVDANEFKDTTAQQVKSMISSVHQSFQRNI